MRSIILTISIILLTFGIVVGISFADLLSCQPEETVVEVHKGTVMLYGLDSPNVSYHYNCHDVKNDLFFDKGCNKKVEEGAYDALVWRYKGFNMDKIIDWYVPELYDYKTPRDYFNAEHVNIWEALSLEYAILAHHMGAHNTWVAIVILAVLIISVCGVVVEADKRFIRNNTPVRKLVEMEYAESPSPLQKGTGPLAQRILEREMNENNDKADTKGDEGNEDTSD